MNRVASTTLIHASSTALRITICSLAYQLNSKLGKGATLEDYVAARMKQ